MKTSKIAEKAAPLVRNDDQGGFPSQQQDPPGLTELMQPRPDHGEETYRGSGRLVGCRALITGGDSGIGRAVAIAFAREGADVAVNYLPDEQADADEVVAAIGEAGRRTVTVPGDLTDRATCVSVVDDAVQGLGGLDVLVNNGATTGPAVPKASWVSRRSRSSAFCGRTCMP